MVVFGQWLVDSRQGREVPTLTLTMIEVYK